MNVLLSSVGRRDYLVRYFQQALAGDGRVVAVNAHDHATAMLAADAAFVVPRARSSDFVARLLDICQAEKVRMLCSLHDWEAPFIADAKDQFVEQGVVPVVSDPCILKTCLDKYAMCEVGQKSGFRVPRTFVDVSAVACELRQNKVRFPLVIKPRCGQGSVGFQKVFDWAELEAAYLLVGRRIRHLGANDLVLMQDGKDILIQEWINGVEYGLDVVNDLNGRFAACFVKRKLAMRLGETDVAITEDNPVLADFGRRIAEVFGHIGVMDVDVLVDKDGPCLLEMNPRFGGGYPFSHEAGANVPAALIAWVKSETPDPQWLEVRSGIVCAKNIGMVRLSTAKRCSLDKE